MIAGLLLALSFLVRAAETPDAAVARVLTTVAALVAQEPGKDARDRAALRKKAFAAGAALKPFGWRAAAPLGTAARDKKRPATVRFFAVDFLAHLMDPAAYAPLSAVLLDADEEEQTRSAAAQALGALDLPPEPARKTFCAAFAQEGLSDALVEDLLIPMTRLGCADPAPLVRFARSLGPRPAGRDLSRALRAVAVVARSRGEAADRALLALVAYYPPRSAPRAAVIAALPAHQDELVTALPAEAYPAVADALRSETGEPKNALVLLKLTGAFGPRANDLLLSFAAHPDAEMVAESAEALARLKDVRALPVLEPILKGALTDPRFSPKDGHPDPGKLLARIEAAVEVLRLTRDQRR